MNCQLRSGPAVAERHLPFERVALVLQGGGALGAYQAGVYEALAEAGIHPDWVAGISIGAINAAIIAGNPPNCRVDRLREFWTLVTAGGSWPWPGVSGKGVARNEALRNFVNRLNAGMALALGANGFFAARPVTPWLQTTGTAEATSFYDTSGLRQTLERLVDFDRLNAGHTRFSAGAVNVRRGELIYFDTDNHTIGPEHVLASGALPPGFPAIEIEGEHYWDGGLVSNTPLQWIVEASPRQDTLVFQVDLWSARGELPQDLLQVVAREKEVRFSSRTGAGSERFGQIQKLRNAIAGLLEKLPAKLKESEEARLLGSVADRKVCNIVQLIYRAENFEGHSKDYEFSRLSMEEHWRAGYLDARRTLRHPEVLQRPANADGIFTFDLAVDGRE